MAPLDGREWVLIWSMENPERDNQLQVQPFLRECWCTEISEIEAVPFVKICQQICFRVQLMCLDVKILVRNTMDQKSKHISLCFWWMNTPFHPFLWQSSYSLEECEVRSSWLGVSSGSSCRQQLCVPKKVMSSYLNWNVCLISLFAPLHMVTPMSSN